MPPKSLQTRIPLSCTPYTPYLTLIGPWLKQSALLDHLAAVVDAGSLVVAVDGHSPGVGAARVLTHDSPGPQEQQMS